MNAVTLEVSPLHVYPEQQCADLLISAYCYMQVAIAMHIIIVSSVKNYNIALLVPEKQFTNITPKNCPTCSCASSTNAEFYDPSKPETCCGDSEAKYRVNFIGTWSRNCHRDYYIYSAHWSPSWSPMTGVSHDHTYEVWNACMNDVSQGVASVSQFGSVAAIEIEYRARGDSVKDVIRGRLIDGHSTTIYG